jgi:hypothetical protein
MVFVLVGNHPVYRDLYPLQEKDKNLEPVDVDFYNQHNFLSSFDKFLSADKDKNKPLFLTFWGEDGASYEIHRLTPEQKVKYKTICNFCFFTNYFKSCTMSKIINEMRNDKRIFPRGVEAGIYIVHQILYLPNENKDDIDIDV